MKKEAFLELLKQRLHGLPEDEVQKFLSFYQESIQDRMEEGVDEETAVAQLGDLDGIVREIELEMPLGRLVKNKMRKNRENSGHSAAWIVLAILGAPLWAPLLLAAALVALSVYLVIWAGLAAAACVLLALGVSFMALLAGAVVCLFTMSPASGFSWRAQRFYALPAAFMRPAALLSGRQVGALSVRFGRWVKSLFVSGKGAV
jgi:uncharacterized membrane protein